VLVEMLIVFEDVFPRGRQGFRYPEYGDDRKLSSYRMMVELSQRGITFDQRGLAQAVRPSGVLPRSMRFPGDRVLKAYTATGVQEGIEKLFLRWTGETCGLKLTESPYTFIRGVGLLADAIRERFALRVPLYRAHSPSMTPALGTMSGTENRRQPHRRLTSTARKPCTARNRIGKHLRAWNKRLPR
jgi:hypothetical protein